MKIYSKFIHLIVVLLLFYLQAQSAYAAEDNLCAAFKDAKIDQALIAEMLNAAEDGHLFRIKNGSSKMGFCVDSPVGMVKGNFQNFKGGIALKEPSNNTVVSVSVDSLETNVPFTESLLKGDKFFNAKDYPELMFVSSGFERLSKTRGVLKGNLSMHGVTRPIAFYVEITKIGGEQDAADTILVKATTTVQRSQFNMSAMSPVVSDRVNLCMSVEAERYQSL
jgi:polyisoprenoid-binding protein YceI